MGKNVEIDIEQIKHIASQTMASIQQGAHDDSSHFRNTKLTDSAFGRIPEGVAFADQAQAAQDVFGDVIREIIRELERFGDNLMHAATSHEDNDQAVESTMASMNGRYGAGHAWASNRTLGREAASRKELHVHSHGAHQHPQFEQDSAPSSDSSEAGGQQPAATQSGSGSQVPGGGMDGQPGASGSGTP